MKRMFPLLVVALLVAAVAVADDKPAQASGADLIAQLQRTEARLLKSIDGLSEAQWNYKAAEDKWSIAQCVEHIAAAEPLIRGMIAEAMKKNVVASHDEKILTAVVDRSQKFKAPEPLVPTNRFGSVAAAVDSFKKERAETISLAGGDADLRAQGDKHFLFGPLDAYGWFLFLSAHSERHTLQIEEVKADPGFPKS